MARVWADRRDVVDRAWDEAVRLSFDAGFDFTDRSGVRHKISEESIVSRAVRNYLKKWGMPAVTSWNEAGSNYQKPNDAGYKKGAYTKRARRAA